MGKNMKHLEVKIMAEEKLSKWILLQLFEFSGSEDDDNTPEGAL